MIRSYNRKELLLGIGSLFLSVLGFVCAFLFFRYLPVFVFASFGIEVAEKWLLLASLGVIALICICGYIRWKGRGGFHFYYD